MRLKKVVPEGCGTVWLKLESGNPTGSYKDRMAVAVLGRAIERGELKPSDRVVEYTGGSTGTALAFVAARLGLSFVAVSSHASPPPNTSKVYPMTKMTWGGSSKPVQTN